MDFHKKVLVAGTGKSGVNAGKLLLKKGAQVVFYDGNVDLDVNQFLGQFEDSEEIGVVLGELNDGVLQDVDLCVISPGIPVDSDMANTVREHKIPIWSEIELAYQAGAGKLAAITGTNGKTTTTSLVGEIFADYTKDSFTVGNIGIPYTEVALDMDEDSYTVAEVSSSATVLRFRRSLFCNHRISRCRTVPNRRSREAYKRQYAAMPQIKAGYPSCGNHTVMPCRSADTVAERKTGTAIH